METLITQTKSRQLRDILEKELLSGKYTVGSRFYSERKLAELFNTSHVTVREAVGTLVGRTSDAHPRQRNVCHSTDTGIVCQGSRWSGDAHHWPCV